MLVTLPNFLQMALITSSENWINAFENIHIYPLVCRLLDIEEYNGEFDSPDGDINILRPIIK